MRSIFKFKVAILTVLLGFASFSGCTFPGVYKLNVQQGNIVTQDMLDKLKPGMTARQVIFVMGNPVLKPALDAQQWDYIYTLEERDVITKRYHLSVHFDQQGRFSHYQGTLPDSPIKEEDQLKGLPSESRDQPFIPSF